MFMYKFHNNVLPASLHSFTKVTSVHNYNTRFAAKHSYYLPYARTNFGKFNIRFRGPSVWNTIHDIVKISSSKSVKINSQKSSRCNQTVSDDIEFPQQTTTTANLFLSQLLPSVPSALSRFALALFLLPNMFSTLIGSLQSCRA